MFGYADFTLAPSLSLYSAACIRRIALSHIRWPSFVTEFDQVLDTSRDIVLAFCQCSSFVVNAITEIQQHNSWFTT